MSSLLLLLILLSFPLFIVSLITLILEIKRDKVVTGSHQRYALNTWWKIFNYATIFYGSFLLIISVVAKNSILSVTYGFIIGVSIFFNHIHNEDDWFNGRGKKIWNGIKKSFTIRQPVTVDSAA